MAITLFKGNYYIVDAATFIEAMAIVDKIEAGTATAEEQALLLDTGATGYEGDA